MSKAKLAVAAVLVAGVSVPLVMQHRANESLQGNNKQLTIQVAALHEEMAPLKEQNARLSNALTRMEVASRGSNELIQLRGEVAQLRAEKRTMAVTGATETIGDEALQETLKTLGARAATLKARLREMPEKQIPELAFIKEKDWLDAVARVPDFDADYRVRQAMSHLRAAAKGELGNALKQALQKFADTNEGMLPASVMELAPYMPGTTTAAMLERYKMLQSGKLEGVTRDQALIGEFAPPVDDEYDTVFKFHRQGTSSSSVNQVREALKEAAIAYANENNGILPRSPDQIARYMKQPVDPQKVQQFFDEAPPELKTLEDLKRFSSR